MKVIKSVYDALIHFPWNASINFSHLIHMLSHDYSYVDGVIKTYESNANIKQDRYKRYKLLSLKNLLETHQPKKILEFGAGASTTILSDYADKFGAKVVSVETNQWWADFVRKNTGANVEVRLCSSSGDAKSSPKAVRFDIDFADEHFDLVIIDGPGELFEGIGRKEGVTMNGLEIRNLPEMFLIDGRKSTVLYMKDHPKMASYTLQQSDIQTKTILFPNYQYFSFFKKR